MPQNKVTKARLEIRSEAIYDLYLKGWTQRQIATSQRLQEQFGPFSRSAVSRAIQAIQRHNLKWYEGHKRPGYRAAKLYKEQIDRYMQILRELWTLFYSYDNEKQAALKLGAANSIEKATYRLCEILGVKGRNVDDVNMEDTINRLVKDLEEYKQRQKVQRMGPSALG